MKQSLLVIIAVFMLLNQSCKQSENTSADLKRYFNYGDSVEGGGVKMIPIKHR